MVCTPAGSARSSADPTFDLRQVGRGEGRSQAGQGGHSLGGPDSPRISGTQSETSLGVGGIRGLGVQPCNARRAWASLVGGGRPGECRTRRRSEVPSPHASGHSAVLSPPLPLPASLTTPTGAPGTQPTSRGCTPTSASHCVFTDARWGCSGGPGGHGLRASLCAGGPHKPTGPQGSADSQARLRTGNVQRWPRATRLSRSHRPRGNPSGNSAPVGISVQGRGGGSPMPRPPQCRASNTGDTAGGPPGGPCLLPVSADSQLLLMSGNVPGRGGEAQPERPRRRGAACVPHGGREVASPKSLFRFSRWR